jgi:thiol-disulfide isomerase/thioredoxin
MLLAFALFSASDQWPISERNVQDLLRKSHKVPVFFVIHSPHCGHCRRILPEWRRMMSTYANITDIIIAECDIIDHRRAALKLLTVRGYPTFGTIAKGKVTEIATGRTYDAFCQQTEMIRKLNLLGTCRFHWDMTLIDYPAFVFATPATEKMSCWVMEKTCKRAKVPLSRCFLAKQSSESGFGITVLYGRDENATIDNLSKTRLADVVFDFWREPLGNWQLKEGLRGTRRLLVLAYRFAWQIVDMQGIGRNFKRDFLLGRMSFSQFCEARKDHRYSVDDTPLYIVSNSDRSRYTIWSGVSSVAALRAKLERVQKNELDSEMSLPFRELIHESPSYLFIEIIFMGALVLISVFVCLRNRRVQKLE